MLPCLDMRKIIFLIMTQPRGGSYHLLNLSGIKLERKLKMDVTKLISIREKLENIDKRIDELETSINRDGATINERVELDVARLRWSLINAEYESALRTFVTNVDRFSEIISAA